MFPEGKKSRGNREAMKYSHLPSLSLCFWWSWTVEMIKKTSGEAIASPLVFLIISTVQLHQKQSDREGKWLYFMASLFPLDFFPSGNTKNHKNCIMHSNSHSLSGPQLRMWLYDFMWLLYASCITGCWLTPAPSPRMDELLFLEMAELWQVSWLIWTVIRRNNATNFVS